MYLGIDLGGTNLKSGVIDEVGNIIEQSTSPTNADEGINSVINKITDLIHDTEKRYKIKSVGIGVPGIVSDEGTVLISPNLPGWRPCWVSRNRLTPSWLNTSAAAI